jgi:hypothetical protein
MNVLELLYALLEKCSPKLTGTLVQRRAGESSMSMAEYDVGDPYGSGKQIGN